MVTPAGRISVLIAGNVYVKRALVRRFLEDDGYQVVGDVMDPEVVVPAILAGRPDAVLLDENLARQGLTIDKIRAASPDIRVVAFTAVTPGEGTPPVGADGYLTKGVGLSAVTSTLRRLFAEPFRPVLVGAAAAGAAGASGLAAVSRLGDAQVAEAPAASHGRDWYRFLAVAAGFLLVLWGSVTAIETNPLSGDSGVLAEGPSTDSPEVLLAQAEIALGRLESALGAGEYETAIPAAEQLYALLEQARAAGANVGDLEARLNSILLGFSPSIPRETSLDLARALHGLYPVIQEPSEPDDAPVIVVTDVTDVTDEGGRGDGNGDGNQGGNGNGNGGQNDPDQPDPDQPDPEEPDHPDHPDHPEHPAHPEHPEHPDHPQHPQHPQHPAHPKGKDK